MAARRRLLLVVLPVPPPPPEVRPVPGVAAEEAALPHGGGVRPGRREAAVDLWNVVGGRGGEREKKKTDRQTDNSVRELPSIFQRGDEKKDSLLEVFFLGGGGMGDEGASDTRTLSFRMMKKKKKKRILLPYVLTCLCPSHSFFIVPRSPSSKMIHACICFPSFLYFFFCCCF